MKKLEFLLPSYQNVKVVSQDTKMEKKALSKTIKTKDFIVKSNALVEARYRLSLQESQVILWLLTQIKPDDEDFKAHNLDVSEFARLTNVVVDSRYTELRKITRHLMQRVMEIYSPEENKTIQVAWLSSAEYEHNKGFVSLEFSPKLKPYLLQLRNQFTKIDIVDTLKLKSIYAIRIFELLLQYVSLGSRKIGLGELRAYCGIKLGEYADYFDLKRKVIEKAKTEISSKTEYEINYSEIKESRKVVAIEWTIKKKNLEKEARLKQIKTLEKELHSESILRASMIEYGYSKMMARRLIKEYGEEWVKHILQAVNIQVKKGNAKNPKAMISSGIVGEWKPDAYTVKKK